MIHKIILLSTSILSGLGVFSQADRPVAKPGIVVSAGPNWNNINGKTSTGNKMDNNLTMGFHAGINAAFPLTNEFYLQPGLEYWQKGSKLSTGSKLTLSYVEIPVNFVYKPRIERGGFLLGFGPYVGLGINGKVKSADGTKRKVSFNNKYSASEAEDIQFKKLDAGGNFMVGYEFKNKLSATINAQLGLIDINPDTKVVDDKTSLRNTSFGVSLGYKL